MKNIVYLDNLSAASLLAVLIRKGTGAQVRYFDGNPADGGVKPLIGFFKVAPSKAQFSFAVLKDAQGNTPYFKVMDDINRLCLTIEKEDFASMPLMTVFGRKFSKERLGLFLRKTITHQIFNTVAFMNVTAWTEPGAEFIFRRNPWTRHLKRYGKNLGLRVTCYSSSDLSFFKQFVAKAAGVSKTMDSSSKPAARAPVAKVPIPKALIGVWYQSRSLTLDPSQRSEVFWLLPPIIQRDQVVMFFEREHALPAADALKGLRDCGVKLVQNGVKVHFPDVARWVPGARYKRKMKDGVLTLAWASFLQWLTFRPVSFYVRQLAWFVYAYAYWSDYFEATGIKVHVYPDCTNPAHIPMNEALRERDGVSVSFQWSHIFFDSPYLCQDSDVLCLFSPYYRPTLVDRTGSTVGIALYNGYLADYVYPHVRERARAAREELRKNGAELVVCYLDENSSDDRFSCIPHKKAESIYRAFIDRVLSDPKFGCVFKPCFSHDLFKRMPDLKPLMDKAEATGRCLFIQAGHFKTDALPAEAALCADVTVGLLVAGTAVLESALAGSRCVFLDMEGMPSNDIYTWGRGKVVFQTPEDIIAAAEAFRRDPQANAGFGDLSRWAMDKDLFKDGLAATRMAECIQHLANALSQGKSRGEAMEMASAELRKKWGPKVLDIGGRSQL